MLALVKKSWRLLVIAQILLALLYTLPLFSNQLLIGSDFISFYTGWSIVRDREGSRLYDLELQEAYEARSWGSQGRPFTFRLLPFVNPPHAAVILMPFALLSYQASANAFLLFNSLIAVWILFRLWQFSSEWTPHSRLLLVTTILGTEVFWYGLATRTLTLIVFACLCEYYKALKDGNDKRAAIWLVAATLKPQLIVFPALIPLITRRWNLLLLGMTFGLIVAIVPSLLLGAHIWIDYVHVLREVSLHGETYGALPQSMNNLRMILSWTMPGTNVLPLVYAALLGGVVILVWLWRKERPFDLTFSLTALLGLFVAPHLNYHDTLLAFLPATIIYDRGRIGSRTTTMVIQVLMMIATFVPPILIFTGASQVLRRTWPMPCIVFLLYLNTLALKRKRLE
jgi:hypothetical protein